MNEREVKSKVDKKGRVLIPSDVRKELGIEPNSKVKIRIEDVKPKKSFVEEAKGALRGEGDAVDLLHKKSPFR
ncbi:hypothetical protein AKJ57_04575 [candidate division MSBL1 archaeon SCGC-AAA259A05]|uniref:SpoVT-AbrB domain-containing protein n=1 Tax=candidate division MSBL1 archaeon SCGC-AAA259A05 TaxID=1698259 RepID=A0A133U747_9EURY|nr:hypothetical protein AKJ57_04575 [candidate division MSBL1 archaeon SCGC-AAA259A05]